LDGRASHVSDFGAMFEGYRAELLTLPHRPAGPLMVT
jgi:hypothetical protein